MVIATETMKKQSDLAMEVYEAKGVAGLKDLFDVLKNVHSECERLEVRKFRIGEAVRFMAKGFPREGVVMQLNDVTVKVDVNENGRLTHWTVAPGFLTKVA